MNESTNQLRNSSAGGDHGRTTTRTALWRRRLFEAEAGLTRFVVDSRAGAHMNDLLRVKQDIFDVLPAHDDESQWKAAFFRAQALMEKFVVEHFGHDDLATWARSNSAVYNAVDSGAKHDASVPLGRLGDQAALYESDTRWVERTEEHSVLAIEHCAIWDYRELARRRGITITLHSPCEYCIPATTAMITNKGLHAEHQLTEDDTGKGCVWTASRRAINPSRSATRTGGASQ